MGYRLNVSSKTNSDKSYYGTKLYGYVDEKNLQSYKWLERHGKLTGDEVWDYGCENTIVLTAEEYQEFIKLYARDYCEKFVYPNIMQELKEVADDGDVELSWW